MSTWILTVMRQMPTRNDRLVNVGVYRHKYQRIRNEWASSLRSAMLRERIPTATGPRRIVLTRLYGKRQRTLDQDGCDVKVVVDAMKIVVGHKKIGRATVDVPGAGLIVDDGPGQVEVEVRQAKAVDGVPCVRIEVENIEPAAPARSTT